MSWMCDQQSPRRCRGFPTAARWAFVGEQTELEYLRTTLQPLPYKLPENRDQKWIALREMISHWFPPSAGSHGVSAAEISEAERRLGLSIPLALREWTCQREYGAAARRRLPAHPMYWLK